MFKGKYLYIRNNYSFLEVSDLCKDNQYGFEYFCNEIKYSEEIHLKVYLVYCAYCVI